MQKSVYRKQRSVFGRARDVHAVALRFHDYAVLAEFFIVDFDICFGCEELGRAHGNVVCIIVVRHFLVVGYREFYHYDFVVRFAAVYEINVGIVDGNRLVADKVSVLILFVVGLFGAGGKRAERRDEA